jgi:hypothetical protein
MSYDGRRMSLPRQLQIMHDREHSLLLPHADWPLVSLIPLTEGVFFVTPVRT